MTGRKRGIYEVFELVWENEYYYTDNTVVVYISKFLKTNFIFFSLIILVVFLCAIFFYSDDGR